MRRLSFLIALQSVVACFDFTATREAGIGGRCGDLDHFCEDGLTCLNDICLRSGGSLDGELCNADVSCASPLVCAGGTCAHPCTTFECPKYSTCELVAGQPACSCADGYESAGNTCVGRVGSDCDNAEDCAGGTLCALGLCASQCDTAFCVGGRACVAFGDEPTCQCPAGRVEGAAGHCVDVCTVAACSGGGVCTATAGSPATCSCDTPSIPDNDALTCLAASCEPVDEAYFLCDRGHLYWFDSCGNRQNMLVDCRARGCENVVVTEQVGDTVISSRQPQCNAPSWSLRAWVPEAADDIVAFDFDISVNGDIVGFADVGDRYVGALLRDGAWHTFASLSVETPHSQPYVGFTEELWPIVVYESLERITALQYRAEGWDTGGPVAALSQTGSIAEVITAKQGAQGGIGVAINAETQPTFSVFNLGTPSHVWEPVTLNDGAPLTIAPGTSAAYGGNSVAWLTESAGGYVAHFADINAFIEGWNVYAEVNVTNPEVATDGSVIAYHAGETVMLEDRYDDALDFVIEPQEAGGRITDLNILNDASSSFFVWREVSNANEAVSVLMRTSENLHWRAVVASEGTARVQSAAHFDSITAHAFAGQVCVSTVVSGEARAALWCANY